MSMNKKRNHESLFPEMTVGVMGSAGGKLGVEALQAMHRLGATIARRGYVLITGACPGLPQEAVRRSAKLRPRRIPPDGVRRK